MHERASTEIVQSSVESIISCYIENEIHTQKKAVPFRLNDFKMPHFIVRSMDAIFATVSGVNNENWLSLHLNGNVYSLSHAPELAHCCFSLVICRAYFSSPSNFVYINKQIVEYVCASKM